MKSRSLLSLIVSVTFANVALASEPDFLLANRGPGFPPEVMWISAATLVENYWAGAEARAIGPLSAASFAEKVQRAKVAFSNDGCTGLPFGDAVGGPPQEPVSLEESLARSPISFIAKVEQREVGWELAPELGNPGLVAARLEVRVIEVLRDETGKLREGAPLTMVQKGGSFVLDSVRFCTIDRKAQPVSVGDTLFVRALPFGLESPHLPGPPEFILRDGILVPVDDHEGRFKNVSLEKVRKLIGESRKR